MSIGARGVGCGVSPPGFQTSAMSQLATQVVDVAGESFWDFFVRMPGKVLTFVKRER